MSTNDRMNQTARWVLTTYFVLLLTLLIGLAKVAQLFLTGDDPMSAFSTPWKLLAFNSMMVLVFVARYLQPFLLTPPEPTPEPQPKYDPIEIERERIEFWAKQGF